jgi:hypothetical protein
MARLVGLTYHVLRGKLMIGVSREVRNWLVMQQEHAARSVDQNTNIRDAAEAARVAAADKVAALTLILAQVEVSEV